MRSRTPGTPHRRPFVVLIDVLSVAAYVGIMVAWATVFRIPWDTPVTVLFAILAAAVVADFGSGVFHWACDTWGSPRWPVLGKAFIAPFREHHADPNAITRHGFLEVNGASCFLASPFAYLAWSAAPSGGVLSVFFPALTVFMISTNQVHKWSHGARVPGWVRWLQRRGLVLSVEHHGRHHVAPHRSHYCITLGWCNPVLDRLGFWRRVERAVVWVSRGRARPAVAGPSTGRVANGRDADGPWAGRRDRTRAASG